MKLAASTVGALDALPGTSPRGRERLRTTLQRLGELCVGLRAGSADIEPAVVLAQLRVDLELRLALEEGDTYFGAMLRERPSISHEIAELRREHSALLGELDALRVLAARERRWPKLKTPALALLESVRRHDHHEAGLLQEFLLRDDGTGEG